jgi:hypothetical protein
MARKRGGLAGLYDRNKGIIKTVAPVAAGFIPMVGPLVGAALGAAMGGDREGKGYFGGFDVGGAVQGGLSGYGGAKLGQAAKGGLAKMFTGGVPTGGVPGQSALKLPSATSVMPEGLSSNIVGGSAAASPAASGGFNAAQYMADDIASQAPSKTMTLGKGVSTKTPGRSPLSRVGGGVRKAGSALNNKEGLAFAGNALQTGATVMGSQAQAAQAAQEYEDQQRRLQAQAEMMALFAPQMAGNLGMSNFMPQAANVRGTPGMSMQDYVDYSGANAQSAGPSEGLMDYINDRPTQPPAGRSRRSQGLMDYVESRRGQPAGPSEGLMRYINSRR